ncbi:hypothetical protein HYALB_00008454 [Hymenoscyphus albidus]|uniref:Uncharacterized protein n=1 Tax=Hymenoscyphus albidus TaxID=595503 RepID=A0A9N9LQE7_9HELO|nr:hypothetical protein HYALB_00008454 [Hymenoscyphus albidus]
MVLSAALDSGYVFMALVAILTSVISAVYYLNIIKQVFFDQPDYQINDEIRNLKLEGNISLAAADGVVRHDFLAAGGDENPDISSAVKKFTFKFLNYYNIYIIYDNSFIYVYAGRMIKYG